ncbi:hypothetical protein [Ottowia caeni]|uniref:hypothetical protein n=1 Tax=Ottowia caeni TaxID=2870339 RepID=UPI003D70E1FD|nr:hypothetical protein [Ottowia caeni]
MNQTGNTPEALQRARVYAYAVENIAERIARLQRLCFDVALSSSPNALPALLAFAAPERITYGSDWSFAPAERSLHFARLLDGFPLTEEQRVAIDFGNTAKLSPQHAKALG